MAPVNSSSHPAAFAMENKFRAQTMVLTSTPVIFTSCCSIFKASMLYTEQHFYRIDHSNRIRMLSTNPRKDEKSLLMKISRQHAFLHKYYASIAYLLRYADSVRAFVEPDTTLNCPRSVDIFWSGSANFSEKNRNSQQFISSSGFRVFNR